MAYLDELTGLLSRRALNEYMMMLGRSYTIAMLDVDYFKKFNDTFGHDMSDQVLKMVGSKMRKVGGGGKAYRYGGEEFTVFFPRKKMNRLPPIWKNCDRPLETINLPLEVRAGQRRVNEERKSVAKGMSAEKFLLVSVLVQQRDAIV